MEKITWKMVANAWGESIHDGFVNDRLLFKITVEGSKVFRYKLYAFPIMSGIFPHGNNSKVLEERKTNGLNPSITGVLMTEAELYLEKFLDIFKSES